MVVCAEVRDHAKRSVLRKLLPGLGTLVFQKDLVYAGAAFTGRQRAVSGPDVQRGGHLLQYQYGVYRGSGSGLSDRTCHEASGGIFPFLCNTAGDERVGLFLPFLFLLFLFLDGKVESASVDQTEYYAVHFCAHAAVCASCLNDVSSGKRKMAPKIYLGKTNEITEIIKIKSLWENSQGLFEKYESVLAFVCKNLEFRLNQTVSLTLSLINDIDFFCFCV